MELKKGYTTGTCAVIAEIAAIKMIFEGTAPSREAVITPCGERVTAAVLQPVFGKNYGSCAVKKYAGDDPDVTDGILIFTSVTLRNDGVINIDGGKGVGRVTKQGLEQEIGQAAINKTPRLMLLENAETLFKKYGHRGGADIIVSVPQGEEVAKKTFNPRLGIEGGISILGTSGIVEPMSQRAITETIRAELKVRRANEGEYVMLTPGNYGMEFIRDSLGINPDKAAICSNFIGEALDYAAEQGFKGVLVIGHLGKLVKLAGGIMNTHSREADSRMELLAANTALFTDDIDLVRDIMSCITTDEAIERIVNKDRTLAAEVMTRLAQRAAFYADSRIKGEMETAVIIFSGKHNIIGKSEGADSLLKHFWTGD